MGPIIDGLREYDQVTSIVCATAQHRELLDSALKVFNIEPEHDLDLMQMGQSPTQVLAKVVDRVGSLLEKTRPDWLLVQGDTTTVLGAALAGSYAHCRIGHVEAGLRSHNKSQPFPEELNRCATASLATSHFAPTLNAAANLLSEGIVPSTVFVTGNTVIDALQFVEGQPPSLAILNLLKEQQNEEKIVLVTIHRRENFGEPLEKFLGSLVEFVESRLQVRVIFPLHPNPSVREPAKRILGSCSRINLVDPLSYPDLVSVMKASRFIVTDSGGIQEEGPALGKPVLVVRDLTERPEALEAGAVRLVGSNGQLLKSLATELLSDGDLHRRMSRPVSPYGDGLAASRIVAHLLGEPFAEFVPDN